MNKKITVYANQNPPDDEAQEALESLKMILRLVIGGGAEAIDEIMRRIQARQTLIEQNLTGGMTIVPQDETDLDRLRYALLGALFEAPDRMANGVSTLREKTKKATTLIDRMVSPITNSSLMRPVRRRHKKNVARLKIRIDRLIDIGRTEEMVGRRLARGTVEAAIDEFFDYVAQNPELRQVLQQQSAGMTGEVVDQLRDRATAADMLVDRVAGAILRRPSPPGEANSPKLTKSTQ